MVTLKGPLADALESKVPEITPVLGLIESPGGRVPPALNVSVSPSGSSKKVLISNGETTVESTPDCEGIVPLVFGASFVPVTVTVTVAVSVPPSPSLTV